jgi:hypothetical protein
MTKKSSAADPQDIYVRAALSTAEECEDSLTELSGNDDRAQTV